MSFVAYRKAGSLSALRSPLLPEPRRGGMSVASPQGEDSDGGNDVEPQRGGMKNPIAGRIIRLLQQCRPSGTPRTARTFNPPACAGGYRHAAPPGLGSLLGNGVIG